MTFELVPLALVIMWRGKPLAWFGVPIADVFPGLMSWLEEGVQDL